MTFLFLDVDGPLIPVGGKVREYTNAEFAKWACRHYRC